MEPLLGGGLLFCQDRFHDLNGVPVEQRRRYEHRRDGKLVGVLDGVVIDGVFLSGHSAPFGGPDLVRVDPPLEDVLALLTTAVAAMRAEGVRLVRIRARPTAYSPAEQLLEFAYFQLGFAVESCDLNQHVDLSVLPPGADPLSLLRDRKRRHARAARRTSHELIEVTGGEELDVLHGILARNRASHGRPAPLERDYLARMRAEFPERVRLLVLHQHGRAEAAAVVYRVLDDVDQVVHWADADRADSGSPMDLLAYLVFVGSLASGARLVDLGPARNADGTVNLGLAAFKRAVGATPGTRKVMALRLS